jgi:Histidine kinase
MAGPFGVLEVDSRSEDEFTAHDLTFLQGAANVLGMAIEREQQDRSLKAALAHQEVLFKEITQRVKNSLAIVASMLQLQASHAGDPELTQQLEEAAHRVSAVARAHERIHPRNEPDKVDLGCGRALERSTITGSRHAVVAYDPRRAARRHALARCLLPGLRDEPGD